MKRFIHQESSLAVRRVTGGDRAGPVGNMYPAYSDGRDCRRNSMDILSGCVTNNLHVSRTRIGHALAAARLRLSRGPCTVVDRQYRGCRFGEVFGPVPPGAWQRRHLTNQVRIVANHGPCRCDPCPQEDYASL
jgi:hypothetical protein